MARKNYIIPAKTQHSGRYRDDLFVVVTAEILRDISQGLQNTTVAQAICAALAMAILLRRHHSSLSILQGETG